MTQTKGRKKPGVRVVGGVRRKPGLLGLLALTIVALAGLGWFAAFVVSEPELDLTPYTNGEASIETIHTHGIQLGSTFENIQRHYPELAYTDATQTKGMFRKNDAVHTIWFLTDNGKNISYRFRYDKNFPGNSEDFIITKFGQRYGRITYNTCSDRIGTKRRDCHFRWYGSDSTSVDVFTRVNQGNPDAPLHLGVVVTNTYLEQKSMRK